MPPPPLNVRNVQPGWIVQHVAKDILRLIFVECLGDDFLSFSPKEVPLVLCQICSSWRKIAINTQELWSQICVYVSGKMGMGVFIHNEEIMKLYLKQAGSYPLMVALYKKSLKNYEKYFQNNSVEILLCNMSRVESLEIAIGFKPFKNCFEMPGTSQECEQMKLTTRNYQHLTSLELSVSKICVQDCLKIMSVAATTLLLCHISNIVPLAEFVPNPIANSIVLPMLTYLDVESLEDEDLAQDRSCLTIFFQYIKTPSLTSLHLQERFCEWDQNVFASFIDRSYFSRSLHYLSLKVIDSTNTEKIQFLSQFPNLIILNMQSGTIRDMDEADFLTERFIHAMKEFDHSTRKFCLCPKLESIEIDYDALAIPSEKTIFADMIESRWRGIPGARYLDQVAIGNFAMEERYNNNFDIIRLLVLKRDGLLVKVTPTSELEAIIMYRDPPLS